MKKILCLLTAIIIANFYSRSEDPRITWVFSDEINAELMDYLSENPEEKDGVCIIDFSYTKSDEGLKLDEGLISLYFVDRIRENFPKTNRYIVLGDIYIPVYFGMDLYLYESEEERERNKTAQYPMRTRSGFTFDGTTFSINPREGTITKESMISK